jgi:hypothetical protein
MDTLCIPELFGSNLSLNVGYPAWLMFIRGFPKTFYENSWILRVLRHRRFLQNSFQIHQLSIILPVDVM